LATQLCEEVVRAEEEEQPQLRAFYDLFHHRLISLYYRAWKKYRLAASFRYGSEDIATKRMLCMVGVDAHGARAESGLNRLEVLELAPLLSMRSRPPRVLVLALKRLLPGIGVTIEQFVERKATIDGDDRMQLGVRCNQLGYNYTLGARVLDRTARFRVVLGPIDYDACENFMPGGARYPVLRRVIEQFTRGTLECEVDILLNDQQAPGYRLGSRRGSLLGFNTRLGRGASGKRSSMRVLLTDNPDDARPTLIETDELLVAG
jgi:type VI secretion system protein ImpH